MADNKRVDLSSDLDSLLQSVKAATEEVRVQQQQNKQKEAKAAEKEKSRKQSTIMIAVAAVVLLVVAYFVVFAGSNGDATANTTSKPIPTPNISINAQGNAPNTANRMTPSAPVQAPPVNAPQNDYEQPRGM